MTNKQTKFIEIFKQEFFNISRTCKKIGIARQTPYNWMKKSNKFKDLIYSDDLDIDLDLSGIDFDLSNIDLDLSDVNTNNDWIDDL